MAHLPSSARFVIAFLPLALAKASAPETAPTIYQTEQLDQPPKAVDQGKPDYPPDIALSRINGSVDVAFVIDPTGHVFGVRARKSTVTSPERSLEFDETGHGIDAQSRRPANGEADYAVLRDAASKLVVAAVDRVSQWTFEPGKKQHKAVYSVMAVAIAFTGPIHAGTVSIVVNGLDPTGAIPHRVPVMTDQDFMNLVASSALATGDFAGVAAPGKATYDLTVTVRDIGRIHNSTTNLEAHWMLTRAADHQVVWESDFVNVTSSSRGEAQAALMLYRGGGSDGAHYVTGGKQGGPSLFGTGNPSTAATVALSQNLTRACVDNIHDALKEIWKAQF